MNLKIFEKLMMVVPFSLAFLGIVGIIPKIISIFLWLSVLIYLFMSWKFLSPRKNEKVQMLPFIIFYLSAQTLVTLIFGINDYPMKKVFSYITTLPLLIALIIVLINKNKLFISYPNNRFIIQLVICSMFSLVPLWIDVIHNN